MNEFKRGRTNIFDDERPGHSLTTTTDDIVEKVHRIVIDDRRLTLLEIFEAAGISSERAHCAHNFTEKLTNEKNYRALGPALAHCRSKGDPSRHVKRVS